MTTSNDYVLLVIGSGPGIGRSTATLFASKAHSKIALVARSADKLSEEKAFIKQAAQKAGRTVEVMTWTADITDEALLTKVLSEIDDFGKTEFVFFNAARVVPSQLLETPTSEIEYDFKITVSALYTVAKWAIPRLTNLRKENPQARPSLLVTTGALHLDPLTWVFSLSLTKTAQRSLVISLAKEFGKDVHIGLVSVFGPVSPEKKKLNAEYIATQVWEMYAQAPGEQTVDIEIDEPN